MSLHRTPTVFHRANGELVNLLSKISGSNMMSADNVPASEIIVCGRLDHFAPALRTSDINYCHTMRVRRTLLQTLCERRCIDICIRRRV